MHAITCILVLASTLVFVAGNIKTTDEWKYIDYVWSPQEKARAIQEGRYNASLVVPTDVDRDQDGRIFLAFLGNVGTPANIGIVTNVIGPGGPLIQPYPNWSWFRPGDCNAIQNVFRMKIDECNRLWVLDHGQKDGRNRTCPAKLVLFNLNNDKHILSLLIPNNIARDKNGETLLATPMVDTDEGRNCNNPTVYIADADGNGLITWKYGQFNRYEHPTFKADPKAVIFNSGNDVRELDGGIVGLAIAPRIYSNEKKTLYYRPLNSFAINSVEVDCLGPNGIISEDCVRSSGDILSSQAVTMSFSRRGTLFFGLTKLNAIGCWNKYRPLNPQNIGIIDKDFERFQFLTGVKVIKPSLARPAEELLLLANRFVGFRSNTFKPEDVKFRVMMGFVEKLIGNTMCDVPHQPEEY